MSTKQKYSPKSVPDIDTTPFESAEEAWFWFIAAQKALNEGARFRAGFSLYPRPCEPLDIFHVVDRLYRKRRLLMDHILVLRHYGRRMLPPDSYRHREIRAARLWKEAMERIEEVLVQKQIVEKPFLPENTKSDYSFNQEGALAWT